MGVDFFQTRMGQQFIEGTMPRIASALEKIVEHLGDKKKAKVNTASGVYVGTFDGDEQISAEEEIASYLHMKYMGNETQCGHAGRAILGFVLRKFRPDLFIGEEVNVEKSPFTGLLNIRFIDQGEAAKSGHPTFALLGPYKSFSFFDGTNTSEGADSIVGHSTDHHEIPIARRVRSGRDQFWQLAGDLFFKNFVIEVM